jgi:hypothetical protein
VLDRLSAMPHSAIDYSDVPLLTDEQLAKMAMYRERARRPDGASGHPTRINLA